MKELLREKKGEKKERIVKVKERKKERMNERVVA